MQKQVVCLIQCLPYTPLECIFKDVVQLQTQNTYQKLIDYVNSDKEFCQSGINTSFSDYGLASKLNPSLFFNLSQDDIQNKMQISNVCFSAMNTSDFLDASGDQET